MPNADSKNTWKIAEKGAPSPFGEPLHTNTRSCRLPLFETPSLSNSRGGRGTVAPAADSRRLFRGIRMRRRCESERLAGGFVFEDHEGYAGEEAVFGLREVEAGDRLD